MLFLLQTLSDQRICRNYPNSCSHALLKLCHETPITISHVALPNFSHLPRCSTTENVCPLETISYRLMIIADILAMLLLLYSICNVLHLPVDNVLMNFGSPRLRPSHNGRISRKTVIQRDRCSNSVDLYLAALSRSNIYLCLSTLVVRPCPEHSRSLASCCSLFLIYVQ